MALRMAAVMIRALLFRPLFTPADMLVTTTAAALLLSGHWLASVPVMLLGGAVYAYGRRWRAGQTASMVYRRRKGR